MTLWLRPKAPEEVDKREIPWIGPLDGATIASQTLTVIDGTVTLSDIAIADSLDAVTFTVSGGLAGADSRCTAELSVLKSVVVTDDGRTLEMIAFQPVEVAQREDVPSAPSTTLKRTILDMAFEQASLAGYAFDQTPEERASWLRALDALMSAWETEGIRLDYNFPAVFGEGDENDASGIPDYAVRTAASALAQAGAPGIGKAMSAEARANYAHGMAQLRAATATIPERPLPRMTPRGSGQKPWSTWHPFFRSSPPRRGC